MTAQHTRYGGAREVVLGRTETAAEDYHAGTRKGVSEYLGDIFFSVAHDGLKADFEPRFIQFLRKEQRIGVLEVWRQQLGSDCDNLGFHAGGNPFVILCVFVSSWWSSPYHERREDTKRIT